MNKKMTAIYVKANILARRTKERTVETVKNIFTDEAGEVNVVAIVVLIGVAVLLAFVFKGKITDLLDSLFGTITNTSTNVINGDAPK